MSSRSKLVFAGLAAALAMSLGVTTASANRLSLSHGNLWQVIWNPLAFKGAGITIASCPVTLEGSFHSATINKVIGALIGFISRASVGGCSTEGRASVLQESLPWHIRYGGFVGTLPLIEGVRLQLINASFRITRIPLFGECLARTTAERPAIGIAGIRSYVSGNGIVSSLTAESGAKIPCGSLTGEFEGTGTVREVPGGSVNLLVRLI
jgi:hypothetical protein